MSKKKLLCLALVLCLVPTACAGPAGPAGPQGDPGPAGPAGPAGTPGEDGKDAVSQSGDEYVMSPDIVESMFVSPGVNGNFQYNGKFYTDYATLAEAQTAAHALAVQLAAEGIVLLKNDNALPLTEDEKDITLLGIRTARMIRSGFGSGAGGGSAISTLLADAMRAAGYNINPKPIEVYDREVRLMREDLVLELGQEFYGPSITSTYQAYGDAAILTFSRTGAENYDLATNNAAGHSNPDDHFLMLDDNEVALVKHAKAHFDKVIVLINSSNIMQIPELDAPKTADNLGVDAILWVGGVGQDGCTAIAHILNGDINPSGHTVDLW
jgi:beta-glucosidase